MKAPTDMGVPRGDLSPVWGLMSRDCAISHQPPSAITNHQSAPITNQSQPSPITSTQAPPHASPRPPLLVTTPASCLLPRASPARGSQLHRRRRSPHPSPVPGGHTCGRCTPAPCSLACTPPRSSLFRRGGRWPRSASTDPLPRRPPRGAGASPSRASATTAGSDGAIVRPVHPCRHRGTSIAIAMPVAERTASHSAP